MNCTPTVDQGDIQRAYPLLADACLRVAQREGSPYFAPGLYAEIMAGHWALFVVREQGEQLGLFVCRAEVSPRETDRKMFVLLAYVVPGAPPAALATGFAACKAYAVQCQCTQVQFASKRAGWARRARQLGYKPAQQIYEIEVMP